MPYFLTDFLAQYPDIEIVLDVTNKAKVIESLRKNEVDFSLVTVIPNKLPVEKIELMQNQLYLVGNAAYPLETQLYSQNILEKLPLIYREPGSGTRFTMEKFCF